MIRIKLTEDNDIEMTDEEFDDFFNEYDLEPDDIIYEADEVKDYITDITLLDIDDAESILSKEQRQCKASKQAIKNDIYEGDNGYCLWWLSDALQSSLGVAYAYYINSEGERDAIRVDSFMGVRPALMLDYTRNKNNSRFE